MDAQILLDMTLYWWLVFMENAFYDKAGMF